MDNILRDRIFALAEFGWSTGRISDVLALEPAEVQNVLDAPATLHRTPKGKARRRTSKHQWTFGTVRSQDVAAWRDMSEEGMSVQEIAFRANRSASTVLEHLRRIGCEPPADRRAVGWFVTPDELGLWIDMHMAGFTPHEIAMAFGRADMTVRTKLRRAGLRLAGRGKRDGFRFAAIVTRTPEDKRQMLEAIRTTADQTG